MTASADIRLRAAEPEDLELAYALENDTALWAFGSSNVPFSRYTLKRFLEQNTADIYADKQVRLTVDSRSTAADGCVDRQEWTPVGFVDLFNFDPHNRRAEVGIALLPQHQGRGVGQTALRLLADYALRLDLHQLYAVVATRNEKASHAFGQAGYVPVALLHDWLCDGAAFADARLWQAIISRDRACCCPAGRS